jgi:hypothetical protein
MNKLIQFPPNPHFEKEKLIHEIGQAVVNDVAINKALTQDCFFLIMPKVARVIAINDLHNN